jgi:hypothetical protein
LSGAYVGGQAICTLKPSDWYRERFWAFFIGGKWTGRNYYIPASGDLTLALPIDPNTSVATVWACECGEWDSFEGDSIPNSEALFEEANDADTLVIRWASSYSVTSPVNDSQLSNIAITGARRGRNVAPVPYLPTRGALTYGIELTGGFAYIVRWYAGTLLVAEGYSDNDATATVTCSERNGSGLTVTCDLNYSADLKPGASIVHVKWPKSYQIHYSTSSLSYPRTPEATVQDNGNDEYFYRAAGLTVGNYNYNVLQVDDEGNAQTSITAPSDSPQSITPGPIAPSGLEVTESGGNYTASWTNGETGCTYTVYYSDLDAPINYGTQLSGPTPVGPSATNATSASLGALTGAAPYDRTSNYATLVSSHSTAVLASRVAFAAGETGFYDSLDTLRQALYTAIDTWGGVIGKTLSDAKEQIDKQIAVVEDYVEVLEYEQETAGVAYTTAEWQDRVGIYYGGLLAFLSTQLDGSAGRYSIREGILPGTGQAGSGTFEDTAAEGTSGYLNYSVQQTLKAAGEPLTGYSIRRFVVRATKSGVEERNDQVFRLEINGSDLPELPRPNTAQIRTLEFDASGNVAIEAVVLSADALEDATDVDLYVVVAGAAITLGTASDSATLSDDLGGYKIATFTYAMGGAEGWFDFAVVARTAAGQRSATYLRKTLYYGGTDVPAAVTSIMALAQRNVGIRPEEA